MIRLLEHRIWAKTFKAFRIRLMQQYRLKKNYNKSIEKKVCLKVEKILELMDDIVFRDYEKTEHASDLNRIYYFFGGDDDKNS